MKKLALPLFSFFIFYNSTIPSRGIWIRNKQTGEVKWIPSQDPHKLRELTIYILQSFSQGTRPSLYEMTHTIYPLALRPAWELVKEE